MYLPFLSRVSCLHLVNADKNQFKEHWAFLYQIIFGYGNALVLFFINPATSIYPPALFRAHARYYSRS